MNKAKWLLVPLLILLFCSPVSAEFYKYTDADGNVRFTDDLSNVPEDQRPDVRRYQESKTTAAPAPLPINPAKTVKPPVQSAQKNNASLTTTNRQIKAKRDALDMEYQELMKEKDLLAKEKAKAKKKPAIQDYNRKIQAHNEKIHQWEQKRKALNSELDAYNARVAESLKNPGKKIEEPKK